MTDPHLTKEILHKIAQDNDFMNVDEPELIELNQSPSPSPSPSPTSSKSPSSVSSGSTDITTIFSPISPIQSTISLTPSPSVSPAVFLSSPSLRCLLPPGYDPSWVVWSNRNDTSEIGSQLDRLTPTSQLEVDIITDSIFGAIDEEMINDPEFLEIYQQDWYKDEKENMTDNQANLQLSLKRKRE